MITVVGWDGSPLSGEAAAAVAEADLLVGGSRHLDALGGGSPAERVVLGDVTAAVDRLSRHAGKAVVLASGDPGFFGILRLLRERLGPAAPLRVLPAVSSVAQAFARVGLPWDDALVVSAHGRHLAPAAAVCRSHPKVAVLTAPGAGPAELGAELSRGAAPARRYVVAEHLGSPRERVVEVATAADLARGDWSDPNVVLCLDAARPVAPTAWLWPRPEVPAAWALAEADLDHRDGMVTKAEVRALALARLAPAPGTHVWDVGAGSGSVAVECARFGAAVTAVERDPEQCRRVRANADRHGVAVAVVQGAAPAALAGLPDADAVFVGGGGPDVVTAVAARRPGRPRRVVVALAAVDRVGPTADLLEGEGYAVEGSQLQASRLSRLPDGSRRLAALNPVTLLWGVLP